MIIHFFKTLLLGQGVIEQRIFILSEFILIICHFFAFVTSLQTPVDVACSEGNHEAVKVLKEYAEVCGSEVKKGCVLNLDAFLPHSQSNALYLMLITCSLSLSTSLSLSLITYSQSSFSLY